MSHDFILDIHDIDTSQYIVKIIYNNKEYVKIMTDYFLNTFQVIIKLYPQILKKALTDNKNNENYFNIIEINGSINNSDKHSESKNQLKITFVIDLQFTKETISFNLDEIEITDAIRITRLEDINKKLSKKLEAILKYLHLKDKKKELFNNVDEYNPENIHFNSLEEADAIFNKFNERYMDVSK